jgi:hypothetical protein
MIERLRHPDTTDAIMARRGQARTQTGRRPEYQRISSVRLCHKIVKCHELCRL